MHDEARDQAGAHEAEARLGFRDLRRYFRSRLPANATDRSGVMAGEIRTGDGGHVPEEDPCHVADAVLEEEVLSGEARLQKCMDVGWTLQTENALNPSWVYHTWDPAQKCQIVAKDPPLKHAECLRLIDTLIEHLPKEGVLTKFSTPKGLKESYDVEVIPFNLTLCCAIP